MDAAAALTPEGFEVLQFETLNSQARISPMRSWWPSALGHPCDRWLVWRHNKTEVERAPGPTLQSIFLEGRFHQPDIYARLEAMGFELIREDDRPKQWKRGNAVVSGKADGRILSFRKERYRPARLLECKTMPDYKWHKMRTVEDIRHDPSPWTRGYYAQGVLSCFLEEVPFGVFVIKNKQTGLLKPIPFELDYDYAERLLQRVQRLQPVVEQGIDPEPIPYDDMVCGGCGFKATCYPARDFGAGAKVLEDPMLLEEIAEVLELKPAHQDYERRWKALKERLGHAGLGIGDLALVGDFEIEVKGRAVGKVEIAPRVDTVYDIRKVG